MRIRGEPKRTGRQFEKDFGRAVDVRDAVGEFRGDQRELGRAPVVELAVLDEERARAEGDARGGRGREALDARGVFWVDDGGWERGGKVV